MFNSHRQGLCLREPFRWAFLFLRTLNLGVKGKLTK